MIHDFIEHVRTRCSRATPVPGATFRGYQLVLCPSWEERTALEGKGVFPLHVDEALAFTSPSLGSEDKDWLAEQLLRFPTIRLVDVKENS